MSFVYQLSSSAEDGLVVDPVWLATEKRAGNVCKRCHGVITDRAIAVRAVLVRHTNTPSIHYGMVSGLYTGVFVSDELAELLGRERLRRHHRLLPVVDFKGRRYPYTYLSEKQERGCARGEPDAQSVLCPVCDRLLYWADHPYVLKRYWPRGSVFRVLNNAAFVDPDYYERQIRPYRLGRLTLSKLAVVDEPLDGLPADFRQMKAAIREGRGCRPPINVW